MDFLRLRITRDGTLRVRVRGGEPVEVDSAALRRLVTRAGQVQLRLDSAGLMFDERVRDLLHEPPPSLAEVSLGDELFVLDRPFDAAALALLVGTCTRLAADPGSGWAGSALPAALCLALQVHGPRSSSSSPATRPVSKAVRSAPATSLS